MRKEKTITMLDLRKRAAQVVREVAGGQEYTLTYRGKAVLKMSPLEQNTPLENDAFFRLMDELGQHQPERTETLSNQDMDRLIYDE